MEALHSSETSVNVNQTTQRYFIVTDVKASHPTRRISASDEQYLFQVFLIVNQAPNVSGHSLGLS
jgi:hypothetical protein